MLQKWNTSAFSSDLVCIILSTEFCLLLTGYCKSGQTNPFYLSLIPCNGWK